MMVINFNANIRITINVCFVLFFSIGFYMLELKTQNLNIGDKVPEITIKAENTGNKQLTLPKPGTSLTILAFWYGACKGCITNFPNLEYLQNKFNDKIQIILVNFESQGMIDSTFKKYSVISSIYKLPKLPSITNDTLLHNLFTIEYYPHYVWIDGQGVVKHVTSTEEVNEQNIQAIILGNSLNVDDKSKELIFRLSKTTLLRELFYYNGELPKYYSAITRYIPARGLDGLITKIVDTLNNSVRISRNNMSIIDLFGNALSKGRGVNPYNSSFFDFGKRIRINTSDSIKFFFNTSNKLSIDEWRRENYFSYELVLPLAQESKAFDYMLSDLERYFNLKVNRKTETRKCFILIRTSEVDRIKTKYTQGRNYFDPGKDSTSLDIVYATTQQFVDRLSSLYQSNPVIFLDETQYAGRIDIKIKNDVAANIYQLKKYLKQTYDLDLIESERDVCIYELNDVF